MMMVYRALKSSLGIKIYAIVALLSLVSITIAAMAYASLTNYNHRVGEMQSAAQRSHLSEKMNSLIYAAVMDSRGVYLARDTKEAEKFGQPLLKSLSDIREAMAAWRSLLPQARVSETDSAIANIDKFIDYRAELVRRGVQISGAAAREFGDNDENRTNRQNLNREIDLLTKATNLEISKLKDDLDADFRVKIIQLIVLAVGGVSISVLLSIILVRRSIVQPITDLNAVMQRLAAGECDVSVPDLKREDELGEMSRTVTVFQDSMKREQSLQRSKRTEDDEKDQRRRTLDELVRGFGHDMDEVVKAIGESASQVQTVAEKLSATVGETVVLTTKVSGAADEASASVQTVASASHELHASIDEISRQVNRSTLITQQAVSETASTEVSVAALSAAAQKIGEVVQLIQSIAAQTNLLALNATIEAARAGEAGRGFAIVASEVKSLATQTSKATEDIAEQIGAIQNATQIVVTAFHNTGATISEINEIATAISSAIVEQSAATSDIAGNVKQAAAGAENVSLNIATVESATHQTGATASDMLVTATALSSEAEQLQRRVEAFVTAVRAA
jgi:methyl-accepting chemotaxis protein